MKKYTPVQKHQIAAECLYRSNLFRYISIYWSAKTPHPHQPVFECGWAIAETIREEYGRDEKI